jgi:hypothetical protein
MAAWLRRLITGYPELVAVLVAAAIGLNASQPLTWLAGGLAAAAFGPAAAAPLGLYGILMLAWGTAAARILRRRAPDH